jgi:hypothetical protein
VCISVCFSTTGCDVSSIRVAGCREYKREQAPRHPIVQIVHEASLANAREVSVSYKETLVKLIYLVPLFAFLLPTLVIGYGVVIPHSPIAGVNSLTVGFGTTLLGARFAYLAGIQTVIKSPPGT